MSGRLSRAVLAMLVVRVGAKSCWFESCSLTEANCSSSIGWKRSSFAVKRGVGTVWPVLNLWLVRSPKRRET
jgi:hypothetical protein